METEKRKVIFSGRVQGVGFRYTVSEIARRFSVTGYVKNLVNGSVELVCQGAASELDAFIETILLERARHIAHHSVEVSQATDQYDDFTVRR